MSTPTDDQFPDRNLGHLRERVASGMPQRPNRITDHVTNELTDLKEWIQTTTFLSDGQAVPRILAEVDRRIEALSG